MTLTEEISAFGGLVGLMLALATLLTANRASKLAELAKAPRFDAGDKWREAALATGLAIVTALVFIAGLPLAVRALRGLHPLAEGGPLRAVFVLAWVLVAALVVWQVRLAIDAARLRPPP